VPAAAVADVEMAGARPCVSHPPPAAMDVAGSSSKAEIDRLLSAFLSAEIVWVNSEDAV
jgi:hypothetical protein